MLWVIGIKTKQNTDVNSAETVGSQRQGSVRKWHRVSASVRDYFILIGHLHNWFDREIWKGLLATLMISFACELKKKSKTESSWCFYYMKQLAWLRETKESARWVWLFQLHAKRLIQSVHLISTLKLPKRFRAFSSFFFSFFFFRILFWTLAISQIYILSNTFFFFFVSQGIFFLSS